MKTPLLEILDDPAQLPVWLEGQLMGESLRALVSDLSAVHGHPPEVRPALETVLGDDVEEVRQTGLSALRAEQLRLFLTHPALLWDLQEDVLIHGGEYWEHRFAEASLSEEQLASGLQWLKTALSASSLDSVSPRQISREALPASSVSAKPAWYCRPSFVSLVTAAGVLLAVFVLDTLVIPPAQPTVASWGWEKPGALPQNVSADVYLIQLAEAAEDWFNKRPETRKELARRILQFRQGCSTLILSKHQPLVPEDERWLIEKCQEWAAKLDGHLTALEASSVVREVREAADETIRKLITALRERAEKVG